MLAITQEDIDAARDGMTPLDVAIRRKGWTRGRVYRNSIGIEGKVRLLLSDEALAAEDAGITRPCELLLLPVPERKYVVVTEQLPYGGSKVSHVYEE